MKYCQAKEETRFPSGIRRIPKAPRLTANLTATRPEQDGNGGQFRTQGSVQEAVS